MDSASPVTYSWFKDGQPVQLGVTKSIVGQGNLMITRAQELDSGIYRVVVANGEKTLEATANITVACEFSFDGVVCLFLVLF